MKIKYYGHSCFSLTYPDGTVFVTDPYDETVTYPPCTASCSAALISHDHFDHNHVQSLSGNFEVIRTSGIYNVGKFRIAATDSFHDEKQGTLRGKNLLFRIDGDGLSVAHLGDLGHMPDENQLRALSDLDVLMIPIGGIYTIDTPAAEEIIRRLNPKVTIAMHFRTPAYDSKLALPDCFARDMNAASMPQEIEITADNIAAYPSAIVMAYK